MTITTASDAELCHAIRIALDRSPELDGFDVQVEVGVGRVKLTGEVGSHAERLAVRRVAEAFTPSVSITDLVRVRATGSLHVTDGEVLEAGRAALGAGSLVGALTVTQHVASLVGHVETETERRRARHAVGSVEGVDFVDDQLIVDESR